MTAPRRAVWVGLLALLLCGCTGRTNSARSTAPAPLAAPTTSVASSTGCTGPATPAPTPDQTGDASASITIAGSTRTYRLGVPANSNGPTPVPLVLNLHGAGSNALEQSVYSALPRVAVAAGYITVTPDAIAGKWDRGADGADDAFLMAILDDLPNHYCIDPTRVFAAGISLGSWKATVTACTHRDRFAAIALVAEEVPFANCDIPVVAFHGTADTLVPYGEGAPPGLTVRPENAALPGARHNMSVWAANAGCDPQPNVTMIGDDVEHWIYTDCKNSNHVEFYSIAGGGHTWPGSPIQLPALGATTTTIDATQIALQWFDQHSNRP